MKGAPADVGDWGLVRVFYEGGRLLRKHFGDFLPIMLVFIFPGCLTKVCYAQFYVADFFRPRGPTDSPTPYLILRLLQFPLDLVSVLSMVAATFVIHQVVQDKIYVGDEKTERYSESFYATAKLAFTTATKEFKTLKLASTTTKAETETPAKLALTTTKVDIETPAKLALTTTKIDTETSALLNDRICSTKKVKVLKFMGALLAFYFSFIIIPTMGIQFTPEAIAAMGLPPWTIFLFTLLMVLYTTLATSYYLLLLLVVWIVTSAAPLGVKSCDF